MNKSIFLRPDRYGDLLIKPNKMIGFGNISQLNKKRRSGGSCASECKGIFAFPSVMYLGNNGAQSYPFIEFRRNPGSQDREKHYDGFNC